MTALEIAIVAGVRFGISEPHAGGLERHTDVLARELSRLGHRVTVFAGCGAQSPPADGCYVVEPLVEEPIELSTLARADVSMPPEHFMVEHDAYLELGLRLRERRFDVVHNNSLHYLPVVLADTLSMVHTLHTPPTPWLESAHRIRRARSRSGPGHRVVSVSHDNARKWDGLVDAVVHNGVELDVWRPGTGGGGYAFWSGRIVPEKGPHLAIEAARRAGIRLVLAGAIHDGPYFEASIAPRLDETCVYLGHRSAGDVAAWLADASVALVTPCWEEPFGLVVAEALACGTPVAAFGRGAIPELVGADVGTIAEPGDVDALAVAIDAARRLDRDRCRAVAERCYSAEAMARRYVSLYAELVEG